MKLVRLLDGNLHDAIKRLNAQPIPLKAAYALKGIQKKIEQEFAKYEEIRQESIIKYGKKDASGNLAVDENNDVIFEEGRREDFFKDLSELVNMDIDVGSISAESLGENVLISGDDLMALDGLID